MKKWYLLSFALCVGNCLEGMEEGERMRQAKKAMVRAGEYLFVAVGTQCIAKSFYTPISEKMTEQQAFLASLQGCMFVGREAYPGRGYCNIDPDRLALFRLARDFYQCAVRQVEVPTDPCPLSLEKPGVESS